MDGVTWDVIVVGAGVVGSATAYQLAKQGFKTLLIEQVAKTHSNICRVIYLNQQQPQMLLALDCDASDTFEFSLNDLHRIL